VNAQTETFRILVIDDTPSIHQDLRKILAPANPEDSAIQDFASSIFGSANPIRRRQKFRVDSAMQGEEGLRKLRQALAENQPYAVAFVDMRMPPGWNGIKTIQQLWAADPTLQVIICTAYSDASWEQVSCELGDSDNLLILKKPFDNAEALQLAHTLTRKWEGARENSNRLASLDGSVRQRTTELRAAQEKFAQAFNANPLPQVIQDLTTGHFVELNDAFVRLFGSASQPSESKLLDNTPVLEPLQRPALLASLRSGEPIDELAFSFERANQPARELRCSSRAVAIGERACAVWVFRDVTEQLQLEHQFRQAQKMEAVGQLAAGIAHDFNNLITVILSYSSFVLDDTTLAAEHRTGLGQVCAAAQRAAALTRQLLVFSRQQVTTTEPIDVGSTLANLREMLGRLLPERIKLEWTCAENLPPVMADAASIEQIAMNLVVNARDAITTCGTIQLRVAEITLCLNDKLRCAEAREGRFVCLSVIDDGKGMEPAVVARIFEPFFTTKGIGQGTGLGLSTVYGIVHQQSGWVEVESTPGRGSSFHVFLPALGNASARRRVTTPPGFSAGLRANAGETILLVEDDPFLRETTALVLSHAGYQITKAADGPSALEAWAEAVRPFDLLLTDLVMPNGLTGVQLAAQLQSQHQPLKVILTTGYSDELLRLGTAEIGPFDLLLKPYSSGTLLELLQSGLHPRSDPATALASSSPK
jgi:signal transduction histidine kinase